MPLDASHPDFWTEALQFTAKIHRDVYPAISPTNEDIKQIARGKVVLVTGAGGGFGKGAAKQWAAANASAIVLAGRNQQSIDDVAESLRPSVSTTQFLQIATDVSSEADVRKLFQETIQAFGKVDVVVHCAGVLGPLELIGDAPVDEWWQSFGINVKGTFLVARELVRVSANSSEVTFIQTGTAASYFASPQQSSYSSSKLATNMIINQLNDEYSYLRVFNVHPGMAMSKVLRPELYIYAKDTVELFGSLTIYLSGPKANFLRNRFVAANWDVTDLEKHEEEIVAEGLLKGQAFKGNTGPGGYKFKTEVYH